MSVPVELSDLARQIDEMGVVTHVVTVNEDGSPHVVSTSARWDGDRLVVAAGDHTTSNARARPVVCMLWPAAPGAGYSLIVDGVAESLEAHGSQELAISPTRAVLHRSPEGDPSSPSCVTVLARR
jgi:hypothetical protein